MTEVQAGVIDQRELYDLYATVPTPGEYARLCELEDQWIGRLAAEYEAQAPAMADRREFEAELSKHLAAQAKTPSVEHDYLARRATLDEFKVVAAEFAPDGLAESLNLMPIMARVPLEVGISIMRVLIDEMGCGNLGRAHATLYADLLTELGMSCRVQDYLDDVTAESLAYVNMFHWLACRSPHVEHFLGGYAFFESSVLYGFRSYAECAQRHGLAGAKYFTEHLHIDTFHSREMRLAIREMDNVRPLDPAKLWAGMMVTSAIVDQTAVGAIRRARSERGPRAVAQ